MRFAEVIFEKYIVVRFPWTTAQQAEWVEAQRQIRIADRESVRAWVARNPEAAQPPTHQQVAARTRHQQQQQQQQHQQQYWPSDTLAFTHSELVGAPPAAGLVLDLAVELSQ